MKREEFREKALIHIASALVKVMDEQSDGILDNATAMERLVDNAIFIVERMDKSEFCEFDDDEDED